MNTIGTIIKTERKLKKLTQSELAKFLGVTQDSISLWEKGKRLPDTQYIILLCKLFDISADYLLGLDDEAGAKYINSFNNLNNSGNIHIK